MFNSYFSSLRCSASGCKFCNVKHHREAGIGPPRVEHDRVLLRQGIPHQRRITQENQLRSRRLEVHWATYLFERFSVTNSWLYLLYGAGLVQLQHFTVCDDAPVVLNAQSPDFIKSEKIEGDYVNGTAVEIICNDNYAQIETEAVCGVDGKWTPQIKCYPG